MAIVNTHYGFCAKGSAAVKFTYTGDYNQRDDGVVELLTSGTLVFPEPAVIDIFCVGGGGSGGSFIAGGLTQMGAPGGAGGYTATVLKQSVADSYTIIIGAGGKRGAIDGTETKFGNVITAPGGKGVAQNIASSEKLNGVAGGSGSGGGVKSKSDYGMGGSDGQNGENGYPTSIKGGAGQGSTTREFGEINAKLYAGGGSGGRYMVSTIPIVTQGGPGGGGAGGWTGNVDGTYQAPSAGGANTGGGGGGGTVLAGYAGEANSRPGAEGGSGIVCFRKAQELPELAGVWVLNERMYAPESSVNFTGQNFKIGNASAPNAVTARALICSTTTIKYTTSAGLTSTLYTFSRHEWGSDKYKYLTFPTGADASDEFRAWLASNATKQS